MARVAESEKTPFFGIALTPMQQDFVANRLRGASNSDAARWAGYLSPESIGYRLASDPKVQEAITRATMADVIGDGLPAARKRILKIINSDATPPGVALKASIWLMEVAGIQPRPQNGSESTTDGLNLDQLSIADLERITSEAKKRLDAIPTIEGKARPVNQQDNGQDRQPVTVNGKAKTVEDLLS